MHRRLGAQYPVFQAPMAGVSGPDMALAAMRAGCIGSIGAAQMNASSLRAALQYICRESTTKNGTNSSTSTVIPQLHVNFQLPQQRTDSLLLSFTDGALRMFSGALNREEKVIYEMCRKLNLSADKRCELRDKLPSLPRDSSFASLAHSDSCEAWQRNVEEMFKVVLEERPAIVSTIFGAPIMRDKRRQLRERGILVGCTAMSEGGEGYRAGVRDALLDVDVIFLQSLHAGGHQGTVAVWPEEWPSMDNADPDPVKELLSLRERMRVTLKHKDDGDSTSEEKQEPFFVACGGITKAEQIKELTRASSSSFDAVSIGTLFTLTKESLWSPVHRTAALRGINRCVFTRSFTGRFARALDNTGIRLSSEAAVPFPLQCEITAARRAFLSKEFVAEDEAALQAAAEFANVYCGSGVEDARRVAGKSTEDVLKSLCVGI